VIALPAPPTYGAIEIKDYIRKNTYRALVITLSLLLLLFLFYWIYGMATTKTMGHSLRAPFSKIRVDIMMQETENQEDEAPPPETKQIVDYATATRAGTPIPVPDAQIQEDMKEFANVDKINESLSRNEGQIIDLNNLPQNMDLGDRKPEIHDEEPGSEEFIPVEKEPNVDLAELQKKVVYPEMARKVGVEGTVIIRVLVGKDGKVKQAKIQQSESSMLDQAAIDAVKKSVFTPAIQNGQPITCWVSIPIKFRLR